MFRIIPWKRKYLNFSKFFRYSNIFFYVLVTVDNCAKYYMFAVTNTSSENHYLTHCFFRPPKHIRKPYFLQYSNFKMYLLLWNTIQQLQNLSTKLCPFATKLGIEDIPTIRIYKCVWKIPNVFVRTVQALPIDRQYKFQEFKLHAFKFLARICLFVWDVPQGEMLQSNFYGK